MRYFSVSFIAVSLVDTRGGPARGVRGAGGIALAIVAPVPTLVRETRVT